MKIGFLGVGNMASAIINGIYDVVGITNIILCEKIKEKCVPFKEKGAVLVESAAELFKKCDYVFLAVKPQQFFEAVKREDFIGSKSVIISIMAGITTEKIEEVSNLSVIRAMPNAPMMNKLGAVGLCKGKKVTDAEMKVAKELFEKISVVTEVSEDKMSAITALSGSGPAYFYLFTKYIAEYAVKAGIDRETAEIFAVQTALGAADVMKNRPHELDELIKVVKSPNGTTERALISFEESDLAGIVEKALTACEKRADELALSNN